MKAVQKKPAVTVKKEFVVQQKSAGVQKKPAHQDPPPTVRKKPAVNIEQYGRRREIFGCYRTIAEAHIDGNYITTRAPPMFMEFDLNKAWLVGEVSYHFTCIGGPGQIKHTSGGGLKIGQPRTGDVIGAETIHGQNYGGFISAKVTSPVPGTSFQARKTNPDINSDFEFDSQDDDLTCAPPTTVVTQKGDIICTFATSSFNMMQKEPEVFVHLLRPMPTRTVAILKTQGHMWESLGPADSLSELVYEMMRVADAADRPSLGYELVESPSASDGYETVQVGVTLDARSRHADPTQFLT